jgi:hypothetical protein
VVPRRGPASGGTRVEVRGDDFRRGARVLFGGVEAVHTEHVRKDLVVALTPPHEVAVVDVSVENPDGAVGVLEDGFEFFPSPVLVSVDPEEGPAAGDTPVSLRGRNFFEGVRAFFDEVACRHLVRINDTELRCETPPGRPGFVDVEVRHPDAGFSVLEAGYFYIAPPEVVSVSPDRGSDLGGTVIDIVGEHFTEDSAVTVDGVPCAEQVFIDEQHLSCTTPPGLPGVVDVTVTNPDGQSATLIGGFNYLGPPVVIQVVPGEGPWAGGVEVRVLGAGFTEDTAVYFGDARAEVLEENDSLELVVLLPPSALPLAPPPESGQAFVDVTVINENPEDGRFDTLADGFSYYWPPIPELVSPGSGPVPGGNEVLIEGLFFRDVEGGELRVYVITEEGDELELSEVEILSPTLIRGVMPEGPEDGGFVDVVVENAPSSSGTLEDGYEYIPPPRVDAVLPPDGPTFGGQLVTIVGAHFQEGAVVLFEEMPCTAVVFVSSEELQCLTPPGEEGFVDVTVVNPDGQQDTLENGYEYLGVVVVPDHGFPVGFTRVTIQAAGMADGVSILFGDTLATDCVRENEREVVCQSPPHALGLVDVSFLNGDGTGDAAEDGFEYRELIDRTQTRLPGEELNSNHSELGDVDDDGDLDLIVANGTPGEEEPDGLYINDGLGNFTRTDLEYGGDEVSNTATFGDLNGDDLPDVVIAVSGFQSGGAVLLENAGDGAFTRMDTPGAVNGAFDAQLVDLLGDARDDLFIIAIGCSDGEDLDCNDLSIGRDGLFERTGAGGWSDSSALIPHDLGLVHDHKFVAIDVDQDGARDIVTFVDNKSGGFDGFAGIPNRHRILFNRTASGQGFLEDSSPFSGLVGDVFGIDSGDINGDGREDVVAPSCAPPSGSSELVFLNNGTTLAQSFAALPLTRGNCHVGVHLFDADADGDLDLAYVGDEGLTLFVSLYIHRGDGTFVDATQHIPDFSALGVRGAELTSGDVDGDGDADLVVASVSPFLNGDGDLRLLLLE